jgi:acetyl-CoA acetyltransferase
MSRWAMGSDGGAWVMDPRVNQKTGFVPQGVGADLIGTLEGWHRADVDAFALRSQTRWAAAHKAGALAAGIRNLSTPEALARSRAATPKLFMPFWACEIGKAAGRAEEFCSERALLAAYTRGDGA